MQHRIELITGSGDGGGATEGNNKLRGSPSTTLSTLNAASLTKGVRNLTISTLLVNETSRFVTREGPYNYQNGANYQVLCKGPVSRSSLETGAQQVGASLVPGGRRGGQRCPEKKNDFCAQNAAVASFYSPQK